jgi:hypothetical protein
MGILGYLPIIGIPEEGPSCGLQSRSCCDYFLNKDKTTTRSNACRDCCYSDQATYKIYGWLSGNLSLFTWQPPRPDLVGASSHNGPGNLRKACNARKPQQKFNLLELLELNLAFQRPSMTYRRIVPRFATFRHGDLTTDVITWMLRWTEKKMRMNATTRRQSGFHGYWL